MSFDSSLSSSNCAMFSRGGVSSDLLTFSAPVDSAKALVGQMGGETIEFSPSAETSCPTYTAATGMCIMPPRMGKLTPLHYSTFTYTAACRNQFTARNQNTITSTLTVNTFAQCLDACDVSTFSFPSFSGGSLCL